MRTAALALAASLAAASMVGAYLLGAAIEEPRARAAPQGVAEEAAGNLGRAPAAPPPAEPGDPALEALWGDCAPAKLAAAAAASRSLRLSSETPGSRNPTAMALRAVAEELYLIRCLVITYREEVR